MPSGKMFKRIVFYEYLGFGVLFVAMWLNELLDIPHHIFGGQATKINYTESVLESIILLLLAFWVIRSTKRLLGEIENIAMFDPLTRLMNRSFCRELLQREVNRSSRSRRPFSIIMGDVDHFKSINDRHGHDCGDKMLQHLAVIMRKNLRSEDVICRWGGEEFLFLLPETTEDEAMEAAEKLRLMIEQTPLLFKNQDITVTMSFGVAANVPGDRDIFQYINAADRLLYQAKSKGRNQVAPALRRQAETLLVAAAG